VRLGLPLPRAGKFWPLRDGSDGVRYEVARLLSSLALRVGVELRRNLCAGRWLGGSAIGANISAVGHVC
jgi:hypothetical protein